MNPRTPPAVGYRLVALFFGLKLLVHLLVAGRYGYHADELYFIECSKHLAWGYVDQTPLVPWLTRVVGELTGWSLFGLRTLPALAGATNIAMTLLLVREWGGGRIAQTLAGTAMLIAPAYLQMASLVHIPVLESLIWTSAAYVIVRIIKLDQPRLWLAVGVLAGVGLLNKPTMALWGVGLAVGLLAGPHRTHLKSGWLWLGVLAAFLLFLPNLLWQRSHEWATLQFLTNIEAGVLAAIPRHLFLLGQLLYLHPLAIPLAFAGLYYLFTPAGERFRLFGWIYVVCLLVFVAERGKPYYLAPAYPPLFAAGATWLEQRFTERPSRYPTLIVAAQLIGGAFTALFALPIASLPTADAVISKLLGWVVPDPTMITGDFHREYGWREQAAAVGGVFRSLPEPERARVIVLAHNYSEASAIDFFGREWGLPPASSGHMNYYLWGPPTVRDATVIAFGMPLSALPAGCTSVAEVAKTYHPLAIGTENKLPVYTCHYSGVFSAEAWRKLKRYWH